MVLIGTLQLKERALKRAEELKLKGNESIKDFALFAADIYTRALFLTHTQQSIAPVHIYFSNRAEAYLRCHWALDALRSCDEALKYEPNFEKTLRRKERAQKMLANAPTK